MATDRRWLLLCARPHWPFGKKKAIVANRRQFERNLDYAIRSVCCNLVCCHSSVVSLCQVSSAVNGDGRRFDAVVVMVASCREDN